MHNSSYAPHYAISRYSIREFNTGAEPFMVAMIIINYYYIDKKTYTVTHTGLTDIGTSNVLSRDLSE